MAKSKFKTKAKAKAKPPAKTKAKPKAKTKAKTKSKAKTKTKVKTKAKTKTKKTKRLTPLSDLDAVENLDLSPPPGFGMHFNSMVRNIATSCGWECRQDGDLMMLHIDTGGGRSQKVAIVADRDIAGHAIARYWSVIGPASAIDARSCLEENAALAYGALAIVGEHLVMMDTQLLVDADPLEVSSSISNLASYADRWEKGLFGRDVF